MAPWLKVWLDFLFPLSSQSSSALPRKVIAGYVPPKDVALVSDEVVMQAKRMLMPESLERLTTFLKARGCCCACVSSISMWRCMRQSAILVVTVSPS